MIIFVEQSTCSEPQVSHLRNGDNNIYLSMDVGKISNENNDYDFFNAYSVPYTMPALYGD